MTPRRRAPGGRWLALALLTALCLALAPAAAQASWGQPVELSPPGSLDLVAPQLAFSAAGEAAAAFGTEDVDTPGTAQAFIVSRSGGGAIGAVRRVTAAGQVLALSYDGRALELLIGTDPLAATCCGSAQVVRLTAAGVLQRPLTLVTGLTGTALGQLLTLADGRLLAAVATERGVWVAQSARNGGFTGARLLTPPGQMPEALAAAGLGGASTLVAWTQAAGVAGAADPREVWVATGSGASAARRPQVALTVAPGHRIDELGVAARGAGTATVAWIESWYDGSGAYHARVMAQDLSPGAGRRAISPPGVLASGLRFVGDGAGDQAIGWQSCTLQDACTADLATRPRGARFGPARALGATDPAQFPAVAMGPHGQLVAAWVNGGRPMAVTATAGRASGAAAALSATTYAYDVAVAYGPRRQALAAWTQGTLNPSVVAAALRGP